MPLKTVHAEKTIGRMAEEKTQPEQTDSPAAARRVVIRPRLHRAVEVLATDRETDITEEVNRAVREMLEREGRWPPPPEQKNDAPPT